MCIDVAIVVQMCIDVASVVQMCPDVASVVQMCIDAAMNSGLLTIIFLSYECQFDYMISFLAL